MERTWKADYEKFARTARENVAATLDSMDYPALERAAELILDFLMVAVYNFHFSLQNLPRCRVRLQLGRLVVIQGDIDFTARFMLIRFPQWDINLRFVCQFDLFLKNLCLGQHVMMLFPLFWVLVA